MVRFFRYSYNPARRYNPVDNPSYRFIHGRYGRGNSSPPARLNRRYTHRVIHHINKRRRRAPHVRGSWWMRGERARVRVPYASRFAPRPHYSHPPRPSPLARVQQIVDDPVTELVSKPLSHAVNTRIDNAIYRGGHYAVAGALAAVPALWRLVRRMNLNYVPAHIVDQ